ncbi:MAG: HAD family phosphatase [Bacillota bacterium]
MRLDLPEGLMGMVFDLDGVIVDSEPVHMELLNGICAPYGPWMSWEEYVPLIGGTDGDVSRYLAERCNLPFPGEELLWRYHELLAGLGEDALPAIPGVERLMRALLSQGIALAVASASSKINIAKSLRSAGVEHLIRARVSGEDVKRTKPAPDVYLAALAQLDLPAGACAAIEDTAVGVAAAKAAGLYTIGFINPHSGNQDLSGADRVIRALDELMAEDPKKMRDRPGIREQ